MTIEAWNLDVLVGLSVLSLINILDNLIVIKSFFVHMGELVHIIGRDVTAICLEAVMGTKFTIAAFQARG